MKKIRYYSHVTPGHDPARGPFKPWENKRVQLTKPKKRGKR